MRYFTPKGINRTVRRFERRVSRLVDQLCERDPMLTRQQARLRALGVLAGQPGSRTDEKKKRKQSEIARVRGLVAEIKRARRVGA